MATRDSGKRGEAVIQVKKIPDMTPEFLFGLLHRKHLLTLPARNNPAILANVAVNGDFYALTEGDQTLAWLIETRGMEPGVLDLALVPEDKVLCQRVVQLARLSEELRERWFEKEGWEKIQVQVAMSRKNTCRSLRALGFVCETRSIGIRKAVTLNKESEALMIYGLLPDDPKPAPLSVPELMMEEAHA